MPPVLFSALLLVQFKLPLFFRLPLFPGGFLSHKLALLLLELQRLLGLCTDPALLQFLFHKPLYTLGIDPL